MYLRVVFQHNKLQDMGSGMEDIIQKMPSDNLTQKDIVQLLLHNAQHMVTREELKSDIKELKDEIVKVESTLKQDIEKLESTLKHDISKIDAKFDKIQWLIVATMITILLKESVLSLF